MKPIYKKIEVISFILCLIFIGYGIKSFVSEYDTVVRWQKRAVENYKHKTTIAMAPNKSIDMHSDVFPQPIAAPLPTWVEEKPSKVAFDVYLSTASNVASIFGTLLSIIVYLQSRRVRKKEEE